MVKKLLFASSVVMSLFACFAGNTLAGDATLTLDDNAGSSSFVVQDSDKTNQFKVNSDGQGYFAGNVGIGTSNPGQKLEVNGNVRANRIYLGDGSGGGGVINRVTAPTEIIYFGEPSDTGKYMFRGTGALVAGTIESSSGGVKFPDGTTQTTAASGQASIADGSVTTAKLKTTTGEVSTTSAGINLNLPGGEYGFFPQSKISSATSAYIFVARGEWSGISSSYSTILGFSVGGGQTLYAQQRYVTSSGKDHWLFLLLDKDTKDIIGAYSAPDHPCYGNGGNPDKVQHPFGSYDQEKHEIVIVDNETIKQLKQESSSTGKSLLTLVNEEYKVNKKKAEPYVLLHSGKFLTQDGKQAMQMIGKLPDYIKVKKLEKFSASEKSEREAEREAAREEYEQEQQKKENNKARAMKKLKELGLTEDEIKALF